MLINITGSSQMSLHEVNEACEVIRQAAEYEDVQINFGIVLDESLGDEVRISVIATGFPRPGMSAEKRVTEEVPMPEPVARDRPAAARPRGFHENHEVRFMAAPLPGWGADDQTGFIG